MHETVCTSLYTRILTPLYSMHKNCVCTGLYTRILTPLYSMHKSYVCTSVYTWIPTPLYSIITLHTYFGMVYLVLLNSFQASSLESHCWSTLTCNKKMYGQSIVGTCWSIFDMVIHCGQVLAACVWFILLFCLVRAWSFILPMNWVPYVIPGLKYVGRYNQFTAYVSPQCIMIKPNIAFIGVIKI